MKSSAITNLKIGYIYSQKFTKYLHGTWPLLNVLMIFDLKGKNDNFDLCSVLLAIVTNIPELHKNGLVVHGPI